MHVAIFDTDLPVPVVYASHGLYSTRFRTLLRAAAARLDKESQTETEIHTSSYDVVHGVYPAEENLRTADSDSNGNGNGHGNGKDINTIDAIIITGSLSAVYDKHEQPWIAQLERYIRRVFDWFPRVRVFGSCFGHQIIAEALLAGTDTDTETAGSGRGRSWVRVEKCPAGSEVGIEPIALDPRFCAAVPQLVRERKSDPTGDDRRRRAELRVQLVHGDWVTSSSTTSTSGPGPGPGPALPAPWLNVGSSPKCPVQGLYHPGRVLSLQGHFEFDAFINRETVREFGRRLAWDVRVVEGFVASVDVSAREDEDEDDDDDSQAVAEAVVLFFLGREG